ncbi:glycosyltransferase [Methylomonas methanica]|uniref:Glycosyl transferase family 2 n=1 Tax=Methylomonas methanica (strain DSM 25384 / MC09) TaxID=857087 RepID=F9ZWG7_METMM|nr:glycosyltransferase [Methylomonas methanica]AEF99636.1 glycosyl transferase family 2 [Methylomonas methanica MC09]
MNNKKVTVIIPTFNRCNYIIESLESIFNQTIKPYEIIIVNDGSTDNTESILRPYLGRIIYISKENGGKSTALNEALKYATGDFIWIFDDDDIALPDALERHLIVFKENPDIGFTYSPLYETSLNNGVLKPLYETNIPKDLQKQLFISLFDHCFVAHPAILVKTDCYKKVGPFNTEFIRSQDYEMLLRLAYNFKGKAVDNATFLRRQHEGDRGSKDELHKSIEVQKKWVAYDQIFSRHYYESLELNEYLPGKNHLDELTPDDIRQALLKRASIMARKGLWELFISDLSLLFSNNSSENDLTFEEREICQKTMAYNNIYAYLPFIATIDLPLKLSNILQGRLGNNLRLEYSKGLFYQLLREFKDREYKISWLILKVIRIVLGISGIVYYFQSFNKK